MPSASLAPPYDPTTAATSAADYHRIERAIQFLTANAATHPTLDDLAAHLRLSPFHLQRLFTRWAGVSPKRFLQALTLEHAKQLLSASASVLDTTYAVGLSSPGRLHDLFVAIEAVTPGEFKAAGAGLALRYGLAPTPYGQALVAVSDRGLCALHFLESNSNARPAALAILQTAFPQATLTEDPPAIRRWVDRIFRRSQHDLPPIRLHLTGTNFQLQVWRALLRIPEGAAVSYAAVAKYIGKPAATRAVASAIGQNPVAWLIPCHRVLRTTGALGGYRWGEPRKQAMLAREGGGTGDRFEAAVSREP